MKKSKISTIMNDKLQILVVDDEELMRISLKSYLSKYGVINDASNIDSARELITKNHYDMVFIDLDIKEPLSGFEVLKVAKSKGFYAVVLSGHNEDQIIEKAYKFGCLDYLEKPYAPEGIDLVVEKYRNFHNEGSIESFIRESYITNDSETLETLNLIKNIYKTKSPIYISGPSGTGKQVIAEIIHKLGHNNSLEKFVNINCSKFTETLLDSELFGHVKGSFTGANSDKKGLLELAHNGTLFLDEIGTMPMSMQNKLLKALEEKSFTPVGGTNLIKSDFRLVTATCNDLYELVAKGKFRLDLFYRICGTNIRLKPLKERRDDIPLLIKHYIKLSKSGRRIIIEDTAMEVLKNYDWHGNTRELIYLVEKWQNSGVGIVTLKEIPIEIQNNLNPFKKESSEFLTKKQLKFIDENGFKYFIDEIYKEVINHYFKKSKGKVRSTIKELDLSTHVFYKYVNQTQVEVYHEAK
ncbi:MAG: sigma-54 dependent transcriptional regulator [Bacteriovoracaceae bacterium]